MSVQLKPTIKMKRKIALFVVNRRDFAIGTRAYLRAAPAPFPRHSGLAGQRRYPDTWPRPVRHCDTPVPDVGAFNVAIESTLDAVLLNCIRVHSDESVECKAWIAGHNFQPVTWGTFTSSTLGPAIFNI